MAKHRFQVTRLDMFGYVASQGYIDADRFTVHANRIDFEIDHQLMATVPMPAAVILWDGRPETEVHPDRGES